MITIPRYGWVRQPPDFRDHPPWTFSAQPFPSHFSLRAKMPPIWQQSGIGSCSAHGTLGAFVGDLMRQGLPVYMPSRLFAYFNGRALMGTTMADVGCSIRDVIKGLASYGVPDETLWPYEKDHVTTRPTDAAYTEGRAHKIISYAPVPQSADAIKLSILNGFPVIFGFTCYLSFEHGAVQHTGMMEMPNWFDVPVGGHCVCCIGWNGNGHYEIRNSWGTAWGDGGYIWMPESYMLHPGLSSDFWNIKAIAA